jgi:hypothetical protein
MEGMQGNKKGCLSWKRDSLVETLLGSPFQMWGAKVFPLSPGLSLG